MKRTLLLVAGLALGASWQAPIGATPAAAGQVKELGATAAPERPTHGFVIVRPVAGSDIPMELNFVFTHDEIYVPIVIRRPKGDGPFPAILVSSGEGKGGMPQAIETSEQMAPWIESIVARGYVVAFAEPRNEIPYQYWKQGTSENLPDSISGGNRTLKSNPTLDSDDYVAIIKYLQAQPYIDRNAVGATGVSHSGELILKAAAQIDFACGVPIEGAAHEFLQITTDLTAPRHGTEIAFQDPAVVRKFADKTKAMERIRRIHTPLLIIGRDKDHQQGVFKLTYEWLKEAGKDVTWASFDHPVHGYPFVRKQKDGTFNPDPIQKQAFDVMMAYFDQHLKHARATDSTAR